MQLEQCTDADPGKGRDMEKAETTSRTDPDFGAYQRSSKLIYLKKTVGRISSKSVLILA